MNNRDIVQSLKDASECVRKLLNGDTNPAELDPQGWHEAIKKAEAPRVEGELPPMDMLRRATIYEDETGLEIVNMPDGYVMGCTELLSSLIASQAEVERMKERFEQQLQRTLDMSERAMKAEYALTTAAKEKDETIATLRAEIAELKEN